MRARAQLGWIKEKVRLRGVDFPEMVTVEGKAANRFTDPLVALATGVTMTTTKPDKCDRYLSDVFLEFGPDALVTKRT